jgi:hypothetical protein
MNFNELMSKMRELDAPVAAVEACGDPMGMPPPSIPSKPDEPPPSMSVNLNAQGMDNIAELMKLMTKVNPDMINQPAPMSMPPLSAEPSIMSIKPPMSGIGDLGNLDAGPLKMLPDLDKDGPHSEPDADNIGGPSDMDGDNMPPMGDLDRDDKGIDKIQKSMGDNDGDGDHDMDDHDIEKDDGKKDSKKDKEEAFANAPEGASGQEYHGMDAAIPDGNDLNRPKKSFSGKPYRGDNPMAAGAYESKEQLRASIKEELRRRLSEAKGKKFDPLKHIKNPNKAVKAAAKDVDRGDYGARAALNIAGGVEDDRGPRGVTQG